MQLLVRKKTVGLLLPGWENINVEKHFSKKEISFCYYLYEH